jgi:hypothetical protein
MNNLPQKIKLTIHGEEIDFSLTDKREIKYYGKTETSNESLWRVDKLEDNEVFYQTEWGWGIFVKIEERELSLDEKEWELEKTNCINDIETDRIIYGHEWEKYIQEQYEGIESTQGIKIPTKLITITYNDKTIESYE